jgi:hypothetical protein
MADQPASLFFLPFRPALDANGIVVPGATLTFYLSGTNTLQAVYADAALTTPLANPLSANAAGVWPSIYLDNSKTYRVVLRGLFGTVLNQIDPYIPGIAGEGIKGDPGGNVSDVGLFTALAGVTIPVGTNTIRFTDRGKAVFNRYTGGLDLAGTYAAGKGFWWTTDASGARFVADDSAGLPLTALGCSTSASFDNQTVLEQAVVYLGLFGTSELWLPRGRLRHSKNVSFGTNAVSLRGRGIGISVIEATGLHDAALQFNADGCSVQDLTIQYTGGGGRGPGAFIDHGLAFLFCNYFLVRNVQVIGSSGSQAYFYGCSLGTIDNLHGKDGFADGCHITSGHVGTTAYQAADISVSNSTMSGGGDDLFTVIGYTQDLAAPSRISFVNCHTRGGQARAFVSGGANEIMFANCTAVDAALAGFAVITDGSSGGLFGNQATRFISCTAINCGNAGSTNPYGAFHIYALGGADAVDVEIVSPHIVGSRNEGIRARGDNGGAVRNLKIRGGTVDSSATFGIRVDNVVDFSIDSTTIKGAAGHAVRIDKFTGSIRVNDCQWERVGLTGTWEMEVLTGTPGGIIQVTGNTGRNGDRPSGSVASSGFIKLPFNDVVKYGNTTHDGLASYYGISGADKQLGPAASDPDSTATASNAGAAPTALSNAVTQTDFNALVTAHNALLADHNDLLVKQRAAGLIGA